MIRPQIVLKFIMKHLVLVLFALLSIIHAQAQENIVLEGKVVDDGGGGIPSASLRIPKRRIGGITDLNGNFSLNLDAAYINDTLVIQSIGFKKRMIPVREISEVGAYKVVLEEAFEVLDEVSISVDKKETDPFRIVREVLERRITNYPTEPQTYGLFYRAAYEENGRYVHYVEALKEIYDRSFGLEFTKTADVLVNYSAIRMTADSSSYRVVGDQDRFAAINLQNWDEIRSSVLLLEEDVMFNWVFRLDSIWYKNDQEKYYIISGKLNKRAATAGSTELFKLPDEIIMTIEAEKFAIRKLECAYQLKRWLPNMRDTKKYSVKAVLATSVHKFDWVDDRLYTSYSHFKDHYIAFSRKTDSVLTNFVIEDESFFTGVLPDSASRNLLAFPYDHQFKYPYELYKQAGQYDPEKWGDTKAFDSDFYQAVVADIGEPAELEAQFVEQGARAVAYQNCREKYSRQIFLPAEKERLMNECIEVELRKE